MCEQERVCVLKAARRLAKIGLGLELKRTNKTRALVLDVVQ